MKVAEISIICGRSFSNGSQGLVGFETVDAAMAEFDRLSELLKRRESRANDLEKTVVVSGIGKFTCPLDEISCIGLSDFAQSNEQEAGVRDAFPNLFKR